MIKCANCRREAKFTIAERAVSIVHYCERCLPIQYRTRANSGQLMLTPSATSIEDVPSVVLGNLQPTVEVPKKKKKKAVTAKPEDVVESIPVEELAEAVADGYKADATDGDADGLVQDGTPFQRPEGEILVDYSEEPTEEV